MRTPPATSLASRPKIQKIELTIAAENAGPAGPRPDDTLRPGGGRGSDDSSQRRHAAARRLVGALRRRGLDAARPARAAVGRAGALGWCVHTGGAVDQR